MRHIRSTLICAWFALLCILLLWDPQLAAFPPAVVIAISRNAFFVSMFPFLANKFVILALKHNNNKNVSPHPKDTNSRIRFQWQRDIYEECLSQPPTRAELVLSPSDIAGKCFLVCCILPRSSNLILTAEAIGIISKINLYVSICTVRPHKEFFLEKGGGGINNILAFSSSIMQCSL